MDDHVARTVRDLNSKIGLVRKYAARDLGRYCDPATIEALLHALADPEPEVLIEVVESLRRLGDKRAIEPLRRFARAGAGSLSQAALGAAVELESGNVRPVRPGPISDPDTAAEMLAGLKGEPAPPTSQKRPPRAGARSRRPDTAVDPGFNLTETDPALPPLAAAATEERPIRGAIQKLTETVDRPIVRLDDPNDDLLDETEEVEPPIPPSARREETPPPDSFDEPPSEDYHGNELPDPFDSDDLDDDDEDFLGGAPSERNLPTAPRAPTSGSESARRRATLVTEAMQGTDAVVAARDYGFKITVPLLGGKRRQKVRVVFENSDPEGDKVILIHSVCGKSSPVNYRWALDANRKMMYGRIALRHDRGGERFIVLNTLLESTADPFDLRKNVLAIADKADWIERQLSPVDRY